MRNLWRVHWPIGVGVALLWATVAFFLVQSTTQNHGHAIYNLDDPYIHMAMAKSFVQHGVWGITRHEFTSTSSSMLWTFLLAIVGRLVGIHDLTPLALNTLFATLLCLAVYHFLRNCRLPSPALFAILLATIFAAPLPFLIFTGMEHVLHALLCLVFVYLAGKTVSRQESCQPPFGLLLASALLMVTARYEGVFPIAVVAGLLTLRGRPAQALALIGAGVSPVILYGFWAKAHGWFLLPNSLLLKGRAPASLVPGDLLSFLAAPFREAFCQCPELLVTVIGALVLLLALNHPRREWWSEQSVMLMTSVATVSLHLLFGKAGWFYRYEAYLIVLGIFVVGASLSSAIHRSSGMSRSGAWPSPAAAGFLALLAAPPLVVRAIRSAGELVPATNNIFQQQYQMGRFLGEYFPDGRVAANDIGAISYFADIDCLDVWGLANVEVAKAKRARRYTGERLEELAQARRVQIAMVYDSWLQRDGVGIPARWVRVGQWRIPNNVVCGASAVTFYAVDPAEVGRLAGSLRRFSSELPVEVVQIGDYLRGATAQSLPRPWPPRR